MHEPLQCLLTIWHCMCLQLNILDLCCREIRQIKWFILTPTYLSAYNHVKGRLSFNLLKTFFHFHPFSSEVVNMRKTVFSCCMGNFKGILYNIRGEDLNSLSYRYLNIIQLLVYFLLCLNLYFICQCKRKWTKG